MEPNLTYYTAKIRRAIDICIYYIRNFLCLVAVYFYENKDIVILKSHFDKYFIYYLNIFVVLCIRYSVTFSDATRLNHINILNRISKVT